MDEAVYDKEKNNRLLFQKHLFKEHLSGASQTLKTIIPLKPMAAAHSMKELELTIAYNKSDTTFGWNGFNNALTVYYLSQDEEFVSREHSFPLVEEMSPSVSLALVQTKFLGIPYTGIKHFLKIFLNNIQRAIQQ